MNVGPAIRKQVRNLDESTRCIGEFRLTQPGERFHKPTSTTTTSVDRSSDGFESPQSSAEVAAVNHVDLTQLSHETVTPVCSLFTLPRRLPRIAAAMHLRRDSSLWRQRRRMLGYHGETCNSLQVRLVTWLLRMPIPSFPFPQLVYPLLSDTESTCLPGTISIGIIKVDNSSLPFAGSNAIAVTLQAIGGALLSPTAHSFLQRRTPPLTPISNRM